MTRWAWATLLVLAVQGGDLLGREAEFDLDYKGHRVVRQDASGKVLWSTKLEGYLGRNRDPHILWDAKRVYVSHRDGVTALDAKTGKVAWHTKGPHDRLLLGGRLLVAVDCGGVEAQGRHLSARAVATGKEVFRVKLPQTVLYDPEPIREVAGLFLVQVKEWPGPKWDTGLIDRKGKVVHRLDRRVIVDMVQDKDCLLLTRRDLVRLSPEGKKRWTVRFDEQPGAGGGLVTLKGGDVIAYLYGQSNDSGVQVARLNPTSGKVVWRTSCEGLGVSHSRYEHTATVAVKGDKLRVTSRGSAGTFVEVLDVKSGEQLERTRLKK